MKRGEKAFMPVWNSILRYFKIHCVYETLYKADDRELLHSGVTAGPDFSCLFLSVSSFLSFILPTFLLEVLKFDNQLAFMSSDEGNWDWFFQTINRSSVTACQNPRIKYTGCPPKQKSFKLFGCSRWPKAQWKFKPRLYIVAHIQVQ